MEQMKANGKLSFDEIKGGIKVSPELGDSFERLLIACKKVVYADAFKNDLIDQFANPEGTMGEVIAETAMFGVVNVFNEAKGKIPGELLIPVGVYMVADIADFVSQAGVGEVTNEDIGSAMEQYIGLVLNMANQSEAKQAQQPQGSAPAPQQPGLVSSSMNPAQEA